MSDEFHTGERILLRILWFSEHIFLIRNNSVQLRVIKLELKNHIHLFSKIHGKITFFFVYKWQLHLEFVPNHYSYQHCGLMSKASFFWKESPLICTNLEPYPFNNSSFLKIIMIDHHYSTNSQQTPQPKPHLSRKKEIPGCYLRSWFAGSIPRYHRNNA